MLTPEEIERVIAATDRSTASGCRTYTPLRRAHDALLAIGGKRYLSGWLFEPDDAAWRAHYGARYDDWRRAKAQSDPIDILRSVLTSPR